MIFFYFIEIQPSNNPDLRYTGCPTSHKKVTRKKHSLKRFCPFFDYHVPLSRQTTNGTLFIPFPEDGLVFHTISLVVIQILTYSDEKLNVCDTTQIWSFTLCTVVHVHVWSVWEKVFFFFLAGERLMCERVGGNYCPVFFFIFLKWSRLCCDKYEPVVRLKFVFNGLPTQNPKPEINLRRFRCRNPPNPKCFDPFDCRARERRDVENRNATREIRHARPVSSFRPAAFCYSPSLPSASH